MAVGAAKLENGVVSLTPIDPSVPNTSTKDGAAVWLRDKQKNFRRIKFQHGKVTGKVNYKWSDSCFTGPPDWAKAKRKECITFKTPDWQGLRKMPWSNSTNRKNYHGRVDLPKVLMDVRDGVIRDWPQLPEKPAKMLPPAEDVIRYLVAINGKGPIGAYTKQWCLPMDQRGLPAHCVMPEWGDWNASTSTHLPEDKAINSKRFQEREERRIRMNNPEWFMSEDKYPVIQGKKGPVFRTMKRTSDICKEWRKKKLTHKELLQAFKVELKNEFDEASNERLTALATRLLDEKLLADSKLAKYPVPEESFKPDMQDTDKNRRYKTYFHKGTYAHSEIEDRKVWSCCLAFDEDAQGCEWRVINPDAWCCQGP